jgi:hypothetical protein
MASFTIRATCGRARVGSLMDRIQTPNCLVYTRRGSPAHLVSTYHSITLLPRFAMTQSVLFFLCTNATLIGCGNERSNRHPTSYHMQHYHHSYDQQHYIYHFLNWLYILALLIFANILVSALLVCAIVVVVTICVVCL